ncbi:MAG: hypothetical protein F6K11_09740 [Leptolyngbya sp. SIO3F4]|nr:hypothetical protein [Leptolyngbya sp. SIO3F4]
MGFAVRADQDKENTAAASQRQNLVLLRPLRSSKSSAQPFSGSPVQVMPDASSVRARVTEPADVRQLPKSPRLPLGLKLLVGMQQGSTILTGGLVATALVIYSWTVYLDKTVARSFKYLEALKVSTQQVTTANETLKHNMATQAESPAAGFEPLEPKRAIFLSPAPVRPSIESSPGSEKQSSMPHPLGY